MKVGKLHHQLRLPYWLCIAGLLVPTGPWYLWLRYGSSDAIVQMLPIWYTMLLPGLYYSAVLHKCTDHNRQLLTAPISGLLLGASTAMYFAPEVAITIACAGLSLAAYGQSRLWIKRTADPCASLRHCVWYTLIATACPIAITVSVLVPFLLPLHFGIIETTRWLMCTVLWLTTIILLLVNMRLRTHIRNSAKRRLQSVLDQDVSLSALNA